MLPRVASRFGIDHASASWAGNQTVRQACCRTPRSQAEWGDSVGRQRPATEVRVDFAPYRTGRSGKGVTGGGRLRGGAGRGSPCGAALEGRASEPSSPAFYLPPVEVEPDPGDPQRAPHRMGAQHAVNARGFAWLLDAQTGRQAVRPAHLVMCASVWSSPFSLVGALLLRFGVQTGCPGFRNVSMRARVLKK